VPLAGQVANNQAPTTRNDGILRTQQHAEAGDVHECHCGEVNLNV
jgi:hypothetical protein